MQLYSRRSFIQQSALAVAAIGLPGMLIANSKSKKLKLSFSTLGCPAWSLPEIIQFAAKNNYQGVEIRTIKGELDLTKCPDFSTANISTTKKMFADNNLKITDLGSSANMHFSDAAMRKQNLDEAKHYIDLAHTLETPYIRVFPNKLPADDTRKATLNIITNALQELGNYAKGSHVKVLMETHGDLVKTDELLYVIEQAAPQEVGLVWDVVNMWVVTKEPPAAVYQQLKKYIRHVHIKDANLVDGKEQYVLLGKGETPIKEAIQLLHRSGYNGYYSFEWEKMWHPEIAEPEIALAHYPTEIRSYTN